MSEIKDTKGAFQLRGIISNLNGNAKGFGFEEGTVEKGKSAGKKYRRIRFNVKTSNANNIPVELFGMEKDNVYFYSKKYKKSQKIAWNNRFNNIQDYEYILSEYDLIEKIKDEFKDDSSVFVNGEFQFSEYSNQNNEVVNQTRYIIKSVYGTNSILTQESLNDENFVEENSFQQDIIIDSIDNIDGEPLYINAFTHDFKGLHKTTFQIVRNKESVNMIRNFMTLRYGDFIRVIGKINHLVEKIEVESDWGKGEPIINVNKSLEILGANAESLERKKYSEDDLNFMQVDDLSEEKELGFSLNT